MTGLLQALHQPQGGILNSEEGIRAHGQAALAHGAVLHTSEKVQSWRVLASGQVEVDTDRGCYTADKLVLTAGAWMPELVPELKVKADIADPLTWPILNMPHHARPLLQNKGCRHRAKGFQQPHQEWGLAVQLQVRCALHHKNCFRMPARENA